jgi:hypothetical protein
VTQTKVKRKQAEQAAEEVPRCPFERPVEQASQAAEKVGRFVGRGFSHDVSALDSLGVLTPEARRCHFPAACSACLVLNFANTHTSNANTLKPVPLKPE